MYFCFLPPLLATASDACLSAIASKTTAKPRQTKSGLVEEGGCGKRSYFRCLPVMKRSQFKFPLSYGCHLVWKGS